MGRKKDKRKAGHKDVVAEPTRSTAPRVHAGPRRSPATTRPAPRLTSMVPVRFEPAMLDEVKQHASADGRSVSAWIRRAVERELRRDVGA